VVAIIRLGDGHAEDRNRDRQYKARTEQCPNPSPQAFIFTNGRGIFIDADEFRKRVLRRLARYLELPKLTSQVLRHTIATLAHDLRQEYFCSSQALN
jgi:hypothetical protein